MSVNFYICGNIPIWRELLLSSIIDAMIFPADQWYIDLNWVNIEQSTFQNLLAFFNAIEYVDTHIDLSMVKDNESQFDGGYWFRTP